jgi:hypothetical protein
MDIGLKEFGGSALCETDSLVSPFTAGFLLWNRVLAYLLLYNYIATILHIDQKQGKIFHPQPEPARIVQYFFYGFSFLCF